MGIAMIEKTEYIQWDNQILLTQLMQDLNSLPESSKIIYQNLLKKPELISNTLFLRALFALINYELVWIKLAPINEYLISTDELRQLLPWVSLAYQKSWDN